MAVADAGAVRGGIVGPEYVHLRAPAERRLHRDLYEMGCASGRLSGAQLGIGAGDIEAAQDDMRKTVRRARVAQHDLGHEFR
jgi:hypothetical protein